MTTTPTSTDIEALRARLQRLRLYGLLAQDDALLTEPWVERLLHIEETERQRRSLERRLGNARLGAFKPVVDFDWTSVAKEALLSPIRKVAAWTTTTGNFCGTCLR